MREGVFLKVMKRESLRAHCRRKIRRHRRVPPHAPGMRIGLFGGTFDPPHAAHLAASLLALKRLGLDSVWWLVTPGQSAQEHPRACPAAASASPRPARWRIIRASTSPVSRPTLGTPYTYDTIKWLVRRCAGVHFVWIMGADNLRSFHRWQRWRDIAKLVPFVVIDRLGPSLYAAASAAGHSARPRPHCGNRAARRCPTKAAGLDFTCTASNRHFPRQHCAPAPGGDLRRGAKKKRSKLEQVPILP